MPTGSQGQAFCPDGRVRKIKFGRSDTFVSAPAKVRIGGNVIFGFITSEGPYRQFIPVDDQEEGRKAYRKSIRP
jgi:hypothetical protein